MSLMGMPPEIRVLIYEHLLVSTTPLNIWRKRINYESVPAIVRRGGDRTPLVYPHILRTSKTIYAEAISLLYSGNTFQFNSSLPITSIFERFLSQIGSQALVLRRISFIYYHLKFQDPLRHRPFHDFETFSTLVSGVKVVEFQFLPEALAAVDYVAVLSFLGSINDLIRKARTVEKIIIRPFSLSRFERLSFKGQLGHELEAGILEMGWMIPDRD